MRRQWGHWLVGNTLTLWTHNAGNAAEHDVVKQVVKDFNAGQSNDISLDPTAGRLTVDRGHASLDVRARAGAYSLPCPAAKASGTPVELRIVVDRSIAEIYLATGQVLTLRFCPVGDGPWRLQAHSTGPGDFTVEAWGLGPGGIHQEPLLAGQVQDNMTAR
ncbi:GH32 C-terminal domain-containing protein [Streptomyces cacaoi]